jgi:hypothetical protein
MFRPWQLQALLGFVMLGCLGQAGARQFDRPVLPKSTAPCGQESSVRSPDGLHFAYIPCRMNEEASRTIQLTVMDSAGKFVSGLSASARQSCTPGLLDWLDNDRVGFICRTDPEVRTYFVFDIRAGTETQYPGYRFEWSPDRKTLADVKLDVMFGTPAGENSCLFLNGHAVYPPRCDHAKESYSHIHTFLLPLVWSADSTKVAFVEKIFDWEYTDPFLRYFDGEASNVRYYLVITSADHAAGYPIDAVVAQQTPAWQTTSRLTLGGVPYDLDSHLPASIP